MSLRLHIELVCQKNSQLCHHQKVTERECWLPNAGHSHTSSAIVQEICNHQCIVGSKNTMPYLASVRDQIAAVRIVDSRERSPGMQLGDQKQPQTLSWWIRSSKIDALSPLNSVLNSSLVEVNFLVQCESQQEPQM